MLVMNMPSELIPGTRSERFFQLGGERSAINVEDRTVELAFSSDTDQVQRGWGVEILDHAPKSIRLGRLKSGGPVLVDHDSRDHVGVIESVRIGADKVGRAVVRFGRSVRAGEVFQDIVDGIRRNVSVGYLIHAAVLEAERDGVPTYRVTDWEPYEISLVSIPADASVGVGRAAPPITRKDPAMTTETEIPAVNAADEQRRGAEAERTRVREILAIGEAHNLRELAGKAVADGVALDTFRAEALAKVRTQPTQTAEIGLTVKETNNYSMVRMLHSLANPTDQRAREAAAFEHECSRAAAEKQGRDIKGILVPYDVLRGSMQRELTVGTATAGGHTVETMLDSANFIELLRNAMVITRMGSRILDGLVGNLAIPRMTGGATGYWVAESGSPTESQQAFDQVTMSPKTVGARTKLSRRLLLQSSIAIENLVRNDLATVLGLTLQAAAIKGGGSNEPTGILATAGIGAVAGGTNGLALNWANTVALETAVAVANADVGTLGYLTNAKVRGKAKTTEKFAGTNGMPLWADGNTPLNGYQTAVTNAVPSNLTKGSASGICSALIFGNFADLLLGMWGGLELQVDPYSAGDSGSVIVRAFQDTDVAVRHPESFAAIQDLLTT
jgi:HK97 family phage major capsid protein